MTVLAGGILDVLARRAARSEDAEARGAARRFSSAWSCAQTPRASREDRRLKSNRIFLRGHGWIGSWYP
jgi:hypothetical protein